MPVQGFEEQLRALRQDMELARAELVGAIEAVPRELFKVAPRGEWSVEAVLRHVVKSERFYSSAVDRLRDRPVAARATEPSPFDGTAEALQALADVRQELLAALDGVTEDAFYEMKQLGFNEESIKSILENVAMHDQEHAHQIAKTVAEVAAGL